ncbi:MAG: filamentous hemagglutinin N-terminal domain-containing protein [Phycisphaerales bacterium]|nr:filamentous hemagglutinin N-terminal domain-containing protein [Phycisphaerales bacterium]
MSTHARTNRGRVLGGTLGRLMIAGPLVGLASLPALAGPQGEQVVHGSAQFIRRGNETLIRTSQTAIINYSSFDLASWESVRFLQPDGSSRVLNRIGSGIPSYIDGSITGNGSVYFINNAGIVFGPNAVINAGSFYAAAGNISNRDFIAGNNRFTDLSGDVVNHGSINAKGDVGLLGRRVANFGSIVSPQGAVTFASAEEVFIGQRGSHVFARIVESGPAGSNGGIEQAGTIQGREVSLAVGDHFALATVDTSSIRAQRVTIKGGADSTVHVSGEIDATQAGARGGRVDVFGERILLDGARIDASGDRGGGVIRIGGDYQGQGLAPRAEYTLVSPDTTLRADALLAGSGGRVIVWADQTTMFGGFISARGGALGGDGGFVEVSGHRNLGYYGLADVRAVGGKAGTLLLDPENIHISPTGDPFPAYGLDNFIDMLEGPENLSILDTQLAAQLTLLGSNGQLVLQAARDIFFDNGSNVVSTGQGLLVLEAGRRVRFDGNALLDLGTGSLRIIANTAGFTSAEYSRGSGAGDIIMSAGSSILSNGGTVELFVQNGNALNAYRDSANINISTINVGSGTVHALHTGVLGASNHHIVQVSGGAGITAGSVTLETTDVTGGVGPNNALRMILDADQLTVRTHGAASFLTLSGDTTINSIRTDGGAIEAISSGALDLVGNVNAGAGTVVLTGTDIDALGGVVTGSSVRLTATTGGIGADGAALGVTTDLLAATASDGVFLSTQALSGGAMTVGTVVGLNGITSTTGTITLLHTGDLVLARGLTATGHGLNTDVIRVDANAVAFQAGAAVDAGATGGIVLNTGSLDVNGTVAGALNGRTATFNVGNGGVRVSATLTGFEDITFATTGAFELQAGGRVDASSDLSITGASFNIAAGGGLRGGDTLALVSTGAMNLSQAAVDQIEIGAGGTITLRTQGGDLTLGGWTAAFGQAAQTILDSSNGLFLDAPAPVTYVFNALTAEADSGITFGANVDALTTSSALLDAGAGAVNVMRSGQFAFTGPIDLRSNVLAQQVGGGLLFADSVNATGGVGRLDLFTDTGGLEIQDSLTTGGRNVQLLTAGGLMLVSGSVTTTGGNITINVGSGQLGLTPGSVRLNAGAGRIALLADAWDGGNTFDAALIERMTASQLTVQAQGAGGNVRVFGPHVALDDIALVRLIASDGRVLLGGAGDYEFDAVELNGAHGVEFAAGVTALRALNTAILDGGDGLIELLNPGGFTIATVNGTTLRSELATQGNLVVQGRLVFDGGSISGGANDISLEGGFYGLGAGGDLITTTGTLRLVGIAGDHTFWIGDDGQIVAASGEGATDVLIGNSFLQRLSVGQLEIGSSTNLAVTNSVAAHLFSVAAADLNGGGIARVGQMRVFARDEISFNEQTSSFRDFEAHTGLAAGPNFGIIFRLSDAAQRVEAVDGGLLLDAGAATIFADNAFSGHIALSSTTQTVLSADVTADNGLTVDGASTFSGNQINTDGGEVAFNGDATFDGGDVTINTATGGGAGAAVRFQGLTLTAGGLTIDAATSFLAEGAVRANSLFIGAGAGVSSIIFNNTLTIDGVGIADANLSLQLRAVSPDAGITPGVLQLNGLVLVSGGAVELGAEGGAVTSSADLRIDNGTRGIALHDSAEAANDMLLVGNVRLEGTGNRTLTAGGTAAFHGQLDLGATDRVAISAREIDFRDATGVLSGSVISDGLSTLALLPGDRTRIEIGDVAAASGNALVLDLTDLTSLGASLALIEFGDAVGGDADIVVGSNAGLPIAFLSDVSFFATAAGREIHFENGLTLVGAGDALSVFGSGGTTFLTGDFTTNGGDVLITDAVVIAGMANVVTGGGSAVFNASIRGLAEGADSLVIDAGAGAVDFRGSVGRAGNREFLALLEVLNASRVDFRGGAYDATAQRYNAGEYHIDLLGGGVTEFMSRGGEITFTGGAINLALDNDLDLRANLGGNVTLTDLLRDLADLDARVTGSIRDRIDFANIGTATERFALLDVAAGHAVINNSAFVTEYRIAADEIDFLGGAGSIVGDFITLTESDLNRGILIGGDGLNGSNVNLVDADIAALADGFTLVTIGRDETNVIEIINAGDPALTLLDPYHFRAQTAIRVARDINATGDGSLRFFAPALVLDNTRISTQGGLIEALTLAGGPGTVRIRGTVDLLTNGGGVNLGKSIEGTTGTDDALTINAGAGNVVLGDIGLSERLLSLGVIGNNVDLGDIGTNATAGVGGTADVDAAGVLRFLGEVYNTGAARYAATGGMTAAGHIAFLTNNANLRFGEAGNAGRGSLSLLAADSTFTADAGTGELFLDGAYSGTRANVTLDAARIRLAGHTTFTTPSGTLVFNAPMLGANDLIIGAAGGRVTFNGNIGSDNAADRVTTFDVTASRIDFEMARAVVDRANFTAANYFFNSLDALAIADQTLVAELGDLAFNGGIIRYVGSDKFGQSGLSFVSRQGQVVLSDLRGSRSATQLLVNGRQGVTLGAIGTGAANGVDRLLVLGKDLVLNGDIFFREGALVRPSEDGRDILLGVDADFGTDALEVSESALNRFRPSAGAMLGIGGLAASNDPNNPGFDNIGSHSGSHVLIRSFSYDRDLSIFGSQIEILAGQQVSMNGGAQLRISSETTSRLNGAIVSQGGRVIVNGTEAILNSNIFTNGGDILIRSTAFVDAGANLNTLGVLDDGDFIVTGGVEGIADGSGDFVLNVGRGAITLGPGAGIGQVNRLRSVRLTANQLALTNVRTTLNQDYFGAANLVLAGGVLESATGDITFHNRVSVAGDQIVRTGGTGMIVLTDRVEGAGQPALERITLETADGATEFRGEVTGVDGLTVDGRSLMTRDMVFTGGNLRFNGAVDAVGGKWALALEGTSEVALLGNVGGGPGNPGFTTLHVQAPSIVLGTSGQNVRIDTCGQQLFEGDTRVAGSVTLQAHGFGAGPNRNDSILFLGDIEGTAAGADALTLIVDRTSGALAETDAAPATNVPFIGINGNVGQAVRLGELNLNRDGRVGGFASAVATVVFGDPLAQALNGNFVVNVDHFRMGLGEALVSLGNLTVNGREGLIGDMAALGDLRLNFSTRLEIMSRGKAFVFDPISERPVLDDGTDIVATGGIFVETPDLKFLPGLNGVTDTIYFAATGANISVSQTPAGIAFRSLPANSDSLFLFAAPGGAGDLLSLGNGRIVLDVRSAGPSNTNVAEALAGAVQTADSGQVEQGSLVASTVREILGYLGLAPRGYPADYMPNSPEAAQAVTDMMLAALNGAAIYVDMFDLDQDTFTELSLERLERELTTQIIEIRYWELWYGVRDEQGNIVEVDHSKGATGLETNGQLREAFEQVIDDCYTWLETANPELAGSSPLPADVFISFLEQNAEKYPLAMTYVREIRELFDGLRLIGLSTDELNRVWEFRFIKTPGVLPRSLDREQLGAILAGQRPLLMADSTDNGKEPVVDVDQ